MLKYTRRPSAVTATRCSREDSRGLIGAMCTTAAPCKPQLDSLNSLSGYTHACCSSKDSRGLMGAMCTTAAPCMPPLKSRTPVRKSRCLLALASGAGSADYCELQIESKQDSNVQGKGEGSAHLAVGAAAAAKDVAAACGALGRLCKVRDVCHPLHVLAVRAQIIHLQSRQAACDAAISLTTCLAV